MSSLRSDIFGELEVESSCCDNFEAAPENVEIEFEDNETSAHEEDNDDESFEE